MSKVLFLVGLRTLVSLWQKKDRHRGTKAQGFTKGSRVNHVVFQVKRDFCDLTTYTKVIFIIGFLLTAGFSKAQDKLSPEKVKELTELNQRIRGTYQIQLDGIRKQPALYLGIIEQIEASRSETEITFLDLGPKSRILILPRVMIEAKNFKAVKLISHRYTDEPSY